MIIIAYILIATEFSTIIYNYWAILGLDIALVILWLISFSLIASNSHQFDSFYNDFNFLGSYYYGFNPSTYRNALRVCAIFGALEL